MKKTDQEMICDFSILRELRKRENMSIAELSEKCGISVSVISKLERNRHSAELNTLYRIARVFGLTLSDLLSLAENRTAHVVAEEHYKSGDFNFQRVSYGNMRCMHSVVKAGSKVSRPELHRDDYEMCWVLGGCVKVELANEKYELKGGMAIQFDALLQHSYEVLEDSELIITHIKKGKRF